MTVALILRDLKWGFMTTNEIFLTIAIFFSLCKVKEHVGYEKRSFHLRKIRKTIS